MRTEKAHSRQSLWDMAVQHCGSADSAFDIARLNGLMPTAKPSEGIDYAMPEPENSKVTRHYAEHREVPATWPSNEFRWTFSWSDHACEKATEFYGFTWSGPVCVQNEPYRFIWNDPVCHKEPGPYGFAWSNPSCVEEPNSFDFQWDNPICAQVGPPYGISWTNGICIHTAGSFSYAWTNAICSKRTRDWLEWEDI